MNKLQLSKFFSEAVSDFIYDKLDGVWNEWRKANSSEKSAILFGLYAVFMVASIGGFFVLLCLSKIFFTTWLGFWGIPAVCTLWVINGSKKDE